MNDLVYYFIISHYQIYKISFLEPQRHRVHKATQSVSVKPCVFVTLWFKFKIILSQKNFTIAQ
jgi:hypothetical protein